MLSGIVGRTAGLKMPSGPEERDAPTLELESFRQRSAREDFAVQLPLAVQPGESGGSHACIEVGHRVRA